MTGIEQLATAFAAMILIAAIVIIGFSLLIRKWNHKRDEYEYREYKPKKRTSLAEFIIAAIFAIIAFSFVKCGGMKKILTDITNPPKKQESSINK
jgi:uncharacterized membrane protein